MSRLRRRLAAGGGEGGFTLVELLVASAMGVILLGVAGSMVLSAMRDQPALSKKAQHISSARWVLERLTREIRNGVAVDRETPESVSFRTYVRRTACGAEGTLPSNSPAIECEVTYTCTTSACTRTETEPGVFEGGTPTTIFSGIESSNVFSYLPEPEEEGEEPEATYIGVTLQLPDPSGTGNLTISDGANLRNSTLSN